MSKLYRPAAPFVWIDPKDPEGTPRVLHEGNIFSENDPVVIDKRACFVEVEENLSHTTVESTRQNPGEKRDVRRVS
jgi:hypothetical protein